MKKPQRNVDLTHGWQPMRTAPTNEYVIVQIPGPYGDELGIAIRHPDDEWKLANQRCVNPKYWQPQIPTI